MGDYITGSLRDEIHTDFSTGSGVWGAYRSDITGLYTSMDGTGSNYGDFSNHLIREYNTKITGLGQPSSLFIEPYDGGFRYLGDPFSAQHTGSTAIYSTRSVGFGGPLMRVRRNSDNTEVDVRCDTTGQVSLASPLIATGVVDTSGSLEQFIGTASGYCSVWYDQVHTGAAQNNVVQTTANAQPLLVSGGTLMTQNGKTTLYFDGSNDKLSGAGPTGTASQPVTRGVVVTFKTMGAYGLNAYVLDGTPRGAIASASDAVWRIYAGSTSDYSASGIVDTPYLAMGLFSGANSQLYVNSTGLGKKSVGTDGLKGYSIGGHTTSAGYNANANIQEAFFYPASQETSRTGIQNNINSYYNLY
jgi:hypothetical protein